MYYIFLYVSYILHVLLYIHKHTHTHTHIYIYLYIYIYAYTCVHIVLSVFNGSHGIKVLNKKSFII